MASRLHLGKDFHGKAIILTEFLEGLEGGGGEVLFEGVTGGVGALLHDLHGHLELIDLGDIEFDNEGGGLLKGSFNFGWKRVGAVRRDVDGAHEVDIRGGRRDFPEVQLGGAGLGRWRVGGEGGG